MLNSDKRLETEAVAKEVEYLELILEKEFREELMAAMFIPLHVERPHIHQTRECKSVYGIMAAQPMIRFDFNKRWRIRFALFPAMRAAGVKDAP